MKIQSK